MSVPYSRIGSGVPGCSPSRRSCARSSSHRFGRWSSETSRSLPTPLAAAGLRLADVNRPRAGKIAVRQHERALRRILVHQVSRRPVGKRRQLGPAAVVGHDRVERAGFQDAEIRADRRVDQIRHDRRQVRRACAFGRLNGRHIRRDRGERASNRPRTFSASASGRSARRRLREDRRAVDRDRGVVGDGRRAGLVERVLDRHVDTRLRRRCRRGCRRSRAGKDAACRFADDTGATTDRPSYASGPDSQRSLAGAAGNVAVYATPSMVSTTAAVGSTGAKRAARRRRGSDRE